MRRVGVLLGLPVDCPGRGLAVCGGTDELPARRVAISLGKISSPVDVPLSGVDEGFPDLTLVAMCVSASGSDAGEGLVLFMSRGAIV